MPRRLKTPCRYPGCPELVELGQRYCEKHRKQVRRQEDAKRGNAASRGYDARWQKVREMYLREHPLCEICEKEGRITPAVIVHHKKPIRQGGEVLDMANLMAVCRECHDRLHKGG